MQTLNKKILHKGNSSIYAYEGKWQKVPGSDVTFCLVDFNNPEDQRVCDGYTLECARTLTLTGCVVGNTYLHYDRCQSADCWSNPGAGHSA